MPNPFDSARLKLDRAKHHIDDLHRRIVGINAKESYEVVVEADLEAGYNVYKFRLRQPIALEEFSLILGDAVHNLRAALDHAVYACAVLNGNALPKFGSCNFPFGKDAATFNNAVNGRMSLPEEIQALLRTFRAYEDGHFMLWALNRICNWDKHALVTPVLTGFDTLSINVREDEVEAARNPFWDGAKNQIELFRTTGDPKYDLTVSLDVAFYRPAEIDRIKGNRVDAILNGFVFIVDAIVAAIEAEARRLFPAAFQ